MTASTDPLLLTIPKAAAFMDIDRRTLRAWLAEDEHFRKAVVVELPGFVRISKPRLERFLHGSEVQS